VIKVDMNIYITNELNISYPAEIDDIIKNVVEEAISYVGCEYECEVSKCEFCR
jgi:hypothetical protein